jgi:hypothetical protein
MSIHNLYGDANVGSKFRDVEVDWVEETPSGKLSKRLTATGSIPLLKPAAPMASSIV